MGTGQELPNMQTKSWKISSVELTQFESHVFYPMSKSENLNP